MSSCLSFILWNIKSSFATHLTHSPTAMFLVSEEFCLNGKVWVKPKRVEFIYLGTQKNRKECCNYLMLTIQWLSRMFEFYYTYVELSPLFYCTRNSRIMEFEIKFTLFDALPCTKLLENYY